MARFLVRSVISTVVTILLVSIALFALIEIGSGDITVRILGIESTAEQRASYRAQLGLDQPAWLRYIGGLYVLRLISGRVGLGDVLGEHLLAVGQPRHFPAQRLEEVDFSKIHRIPARAL